jgi:hypothetical protein
MTATRPLVAVALGAVTEVVPPSLATAGMVARRAVAVVLLVTAGAAVRAFAVAIAPGLIAVTSLGLVMSGRASFVVIVLSPVGFP